MPEKIQPTPRRERIAIAGATGRVGSALTSLLASTGAVWQDPIVEAPAPGNVRASVVRFSSPARARPGTPTRPARPSTYILSGVGRVQSVGGPIREVRAGDVVWFPPNEKHWHGAGPQTTMAHVAIAEVRDGKFVEWMEKVTDQQYEAARLDA